MSDAAFVRARRRGYQMRVFRHRIPGGGRSIALSLFGVLLLVFSLPAHAQVRERVVRIGTLGAGGGTNSSLRRWDPFRHGLRELGYVEGKNIVIESRSAMGQLGRINEIAGELVRLRVAVIVTGGASATKAAKTATGTIPIVMAQDNDPVGSGFVESLARPGRNITGLANQSSEMNGKRLELLREIVQGSRASPSSATPPIRVIRWR